MKSVRLGISFSIPPYVIEEKNSGLELEIIYASFAVKGYQVLPSYQPLARTFMDFDKGGLDGVINVKKGMVQGYYSDEMITFQNCLFSLRKKQLNITDLNMLQDKTVVAFQRARHVLGQEFHDMAENNPDYTEVADQRMQIKRLFRGRADVIVLDKNIFNYFRSEALKQAENTGQKIIQEELLQPVASDCLFPLTHYRSAFSSEQMRDDFNYGLRQIRLDGRYQQIIERYRDRMALPNDAE